MGWQRASMLSGTKTRSHLQTPTATSKGLSCRDLIFPYNCPTWPRSSLALEGKALQQGGSVWWEGKKECIMPTFHCLPALVHYSIHIHLRLPIRWFLGPAVNGFKGAYRNDHYVQGAACKGCLLRFGLARKSQPMPSFIPQNAVAQRVEKFAPPHAASAHRVSEASRARPILTRRRLLLPPDRTDHAVSVLIFSQVNCIRFAYYFYNMKITLPFPFN